MLFHQRHDRTAQDDRARARLCARARHHRGILAGPAARRPALEPVGYRLGKGRVGQPVRTMVPGRRYLRLPLRSEEHTSELQSLMRISYAVFCLKKKHTTTRLTTA